MIASIEGNSRGNVDPPGAEEVAPRPWAPPPTPMLLVGAAVTWEGQHAARVFRCRGRLAWDAAFVHHLGRRSHYGHHKTSWPLHAECSAQQLACEAHVRGWLAEEPIPGDVFLLWSAERRAFVRAGIVVDVLALGRPLGERDAHVCEVIEGNTSRENPMQGDLVLRRQRHFTPNDRFVRWCGLDKVLWRTDGAGVRGPAVVRERAAYAWRAAA